jgi:hypothetical protein
VYPLSAQPTSTVASLDLLGRCFVHCCQTGTCREAGARPQQNLAAANPRTLAARQPPLVRRRTEPPP